MKKIAPLLILVAGILWGCLGIFVRKLNEYGLFSMEIVSLRAIVTCVFMGAFLLAYNPEMFIIHIKDVWCFIGTGICSIVFFNYCYFKSIAMSSLSVAAVLLYTAPSIVMILSYVLFKEKITKKRVLSIVFTFVGCVLVTGVITSPGSINGPGIITGLGAGLGYALYSIFSRYAIEKGYHTFTIMFYTFLIAAVTTLFISDISCTYSVATESTDTFFLCIALGILGTVLPYLTYTLGLKYVDNSKAAVIASIEPVTATLIGVFLYNEIMSISGVAGVVLVIIALLI